MSFCFWERDEKYKDHFEPGPDDDCCKRSKARQLINHSVQLIKRVDDCVDCLVEGIYVCGNCGYELFSSKQKFDHHSPWPAFTQTIHKDSVSKKLEMGSSKAYKVSCGKCGNPLGHEFLKDGPDKTSSRF